MAPEAPALYFDHNATTPILPDVVDAMEPYLREHFGNPSSAHPYGRRARDAVERARGEVAALIGAAPDEVLFTSGGTESNNLAIFGVAESTDRRHVVTSAIEHPAVSRPCARLEGAGWKVTRAPVDSRARVDPDEVASLVDRGTALVTIMHANNEVGTIEPILPIARAARAARVLVHTDAAQSVGKVPVRVDELEVDLLTIAGHKLYAPKGVGALYVRRGTALRPLLLGAGHERGLRPGTENVASIVGLGAACRLAAETLEAFGEKMRALTADLFAALARRVPGLCLNGDPDARLPNTLNVRFPAVHGSNLLAATPSVAASTGSACHAEGESASAVLLAMSIEPDSALGSVRLSLGRQTTERDVQAGAAALADSWARLTRRA
jgi:cysteine desulfurase